MELHRCSFLTRRNYGVNESQIRAEVNFDQAQIIIVGPWRDPLHFVSLRVLDVYQLFGPII